MLEFLDHLVKRFEPPFPDVPVTIEPIMKLLQRLGAEPIESLLPDRLHLDEADRLEDLEVLRSLRLPELELAKDGVHRPRACAEQFDNPKSIGFA